MYLWNDGPSGLAPWLRAEVALDTELAAGARSPSVKRVQEWLTLNRHAVAIDGVYGSTTSEVVARYQGESSLPASGNTDAATFARLTAPMRGALQRLEHASPTLSAAILDYARSHLSQQPREVGGQNRGPWVRMYLDGRDGADRAW